MRKNQDNLQYAQEPGAIREAMVPEKYGGSFQHGKTDTFFLKNGEIQAPVLLVYRRKAAGIRDPPPDARQNAIT